VAHRGVYDNRRVFENTLPAFEAFRAVGGWGIELDVRWTRDGVPVVFHDRDGRRLFGVPRRVDDLDWKTLQRILPQIPTLAEVVSRFGGHLHLMVEIKSLSSAGARRPRNILQSHLEPLTPGRDYHLLSLDPDLLRRLRFAPSQACIPIAQMNLLNVERASRANGWGGIAGHYALISRRRVLAWHRRGGRVGTGYINSRYSLYREMARGVDWLFSDQALVLQKIVRQAAGSRG
jgi:glycerophosphoryl diester phosphodiesterase